MCCLSPVLSLSFTSKARSKCGHSPCCSLPSTAGLQRAGSRKKNGQLLTLCLWGHWQTCFLPLGDWNWILKSNIIFCKEAFIFRVLGTQWPEYCSHNSGKTPSRHLSYFFLDAGLQDCAFQYKHVIRTWPNSQKLWADPLYVANKGSGENETAWNVVNKIIHVAFIITFITASS